MPFKKGNIPWNKKRKDTELSELTLKEKIYQELKQNGVMSLNDLQVIFGKTTHVELLKLVDDRLIGMADIVGHDLEYYIKR